MVRPENGRPRTHPLLLILTVLLLASCAGGGGEREGSAPILDRVSHLRFGEREFTFLDAPVLSVQVDGEGASVNGIRIRVRGDRVNVDGRDYPALPGDRIVVSPDGTVRVLGPSGPAAGEAEGPTVSGASPP